MPWDQCQTIRSLTAGSVQALGFFDRWCIGSDQCTVDEIIIIIIIITITIIIRLK